jgi:hypothetical protein
LRFFLLARSGLGSGGFIQRAYFLTPDAQFCTNENSPQMLKLRITITNNYYLEGIGFASQTAPDPPAWRDPEVFFWPETNPPDPYPQAEQGGR